MHINLECNLIATRNEPRHSDAMAKAMAIAKARADIKRT